MKTPVITARLSALALLAACTFGCGTKADPTVNACEEASKSVTEVSNAAQAYSTDPTNRAKCEAYKTAYSNFLSKARPCAGQSGITQQQIDAAQKAINDTKCP